MFRYNIVVVSLLLIHLTAINLFNKVELTKDHNARCLDGSPYAFFTYQPDDLDPQQNKLLIYFEETAFGWCIKQDFSSTLQQCYKFATDDYLIDFGSSKNYPNDDLFLYGILSNSDGGAFSTWRKVLIKSCDGGSYLGNQNPIEYKKLSLYFRGSMNIVNTFNYLLSKFNLTKYQEIVVAGSFNGGIAAMLWSSYLKTLTSSPIRILVEGTIFPNVVHKDGRPVTQNRFNIIQRLILGGDSIPNQQCAHAHPNEQWKCLFAEQLSKYITIPIFYAQSFYDGLVIIQTLGYKCAEEFGSLSECIEKQKQQIEDYGTKTKAITKKLAENQKGGAFGIACVAHNFFGGRWTNQQFQVPMNSGNMVMVVVDKWVKSHNSVINIDTVDWPHNQPCSRKAVFF